MKYKFNVMKEDRGVKFCSISAENFKTASVSVSFNLPLGEKASLYALVPNILSRSSEDYPDLSSLEKKLASLYGAEIGVSISKNGEVQSAKLSVSCIADKFSFDGESIVYDCGKLLFDLIFKPKIIDGAFDTADVESEKRLLSEQLASEISEKMTYAKNRCVEIMCAEEAYGINRFGTQEDIAAITPASLYEAYREMLAASDICVCVSGVDSADELCEMFFDRIAGIKREVISAETLFVEAAEDVQTVTETDKVKQGKLVMGFRLGMKEFNDDYAARRLTVDLFGGSPHSKLFTVVREKLSLCYYCSARIISRKGIMLVQSGIENYNYEKARDAILAQLDDIRKGNFSEDDIKASLMSLQNAFEGVSDSPESLDNWFTPQATDGEFLYPEDYIEQFKKVTKEDIVRAANDITLDTVYMLFGSEDGESNE